MKFRKRILAVACGLAVIGALAAAVPASASVSAPGTASAVTRAARPAADAYLIRGEIESNGWCLAQPRDVADGKQVYIARCARNDAFEIWLCGRYRGQGFCAPVLGRQPLDLGQRGRTPAALLVNPDRGGSPRYLISFSEVTGSNNWVLGLPLYSRSVGLAFPKIRVPGHVYALAWRHNGHYSYVWHFTGRWYVA